MTDRELYAKVIQAMELRGTGYFQDAVMDIVESFERKPLTELELQMEEQAHVAELVQLIRETNVICSKPNAVLPDQQAA